MNARDGHVRVLPVHVANKIAAGEVVERPSSVAKELVENALDAGAHTIRLTIADGGRKLVAVQDDGCGMTRDDAMLCLERQATSKILDVDDIERIDTLGFRGEAIPSIASVSRLTLTTRRRDSDEGVRLQVNAGSLDDVSAAGCPPGTLVEVRDLFCNVPARRKFLRARATEESHVRQVFTIHALAHPQVGFTLVAEGREVLRLAPTDSLADRVRDLFGAEFAASLVALPTPPAGAVITVTGFIERPNLATPTRHDQYVFVNSRPATAPSVNYALREACPRRDGDMRPAAIIFLTLPPSQVDVNVHPTKREVRFRDNFAVKNAILQAFDAALTGGRPTAPAASKATGPFVQSASRTEPCVDSPIPAATNARRFADSTPMTSQGVNEGSAESEPSRVWTVHDELRPTQPIPVPSPAPQPTPVPLEFALEPEAATTKPWAWFKFLSVTSSGYLLIETDAGLVTINPHAARERIAFERLLAGRDAIASQQLLIPETVQLSPPDFARVKAALPTIVAMGFALEEFGVDTIKLEAVPQLIGELEPAAIVTTIARDLADGTGRRAGERWREELIARSIARSFAGMSLALTAEGAVKLVEDLCACRMPYVCPRGKLVMIFTSTRELNRKFDRN